MSLVINPVLLVAGVSVELDLSKLMAERPSTNSGRTVLKSPINKANGVALISVLLVLAIASVAVVSMSTARQADIRRTDNQSSTAQRWQWIQSLEQQAGVLLLQDARDSNNDSAEERWRRHTFNIEMAGQVATAQIADLQGKINLNNLIRDGEASPEDIGRLRRLLTILQLEPKLVDVIVDWIDADMEIRYPDGAEDETYTRKRPSYRAANRPFADLSELLLVEGIDRKVYQTLSPYVFVADDYAPLNINTAEAKVLRCLADGISADQAESMYRAAGKPFTKVEDFLKDEAVEKLKLGKYGLGVVSEHFVLAGTIESGNSHWRFASQLRRQRDVGVYVDKRRRLGVADG